jgi:RHS repeat-associated protein
VAGAPVNPLRFTGQFLDPVTGQYNLRARQYDPAAGRFTGIDPVDPETGAPVVGPYVYAADRPTVATDLSGACWLIPFSGDSSCPGAGTLRATVGVAKGAYHVGAGIVTAAVHPIRTGKAILDACRTGVDDYGHIVGPDLACTYAVLGKPIVDQLVLAATTTCGTTDRFDHLTQGVLSILLLGKGARGVRPRTTAYAHYAGEGEAGALSKAFHYTGDQNVASIRANGLRAGSYATPDGGLNPLQAQIDLALPPNRGLPGAKLRVDLDGLRRAGYDIPEVSQVGRSFNMPGGGYEMQFPYPIPPEFVKVVAP